MCSQTFGSQMGLFSFCILFVLTFCGGFVVVDTADVPWNSTIEEATIQFVQQLLASVDNSKSPCEDFHGFICNKQQISTQFVQRPSDEEIFEKFIQNVNNEDQLMDAELMVQKFYESCQNSRTIDHLKKSHLYNLTRGWPLIGGDAAKNREIPQWLNIVMAFHDIGVDYFFSHYIEIKSNRRTVELKANSDFKYSLRKNTHLAEQLLQGFGVSPAEARLKALDFAGLEGYRREIVEEAANGVSTSMTYREFKTRFDSIDWDVYFRRVLGKPLKDTDGVRLENEQKLELVFSMLSKTPSSRILNYVWIRYLLDKSTASCLDLVREHFQPLYRYIVQFTTIDRRRMANMFSEIGSVYQSLLPDSIWIDEISNQKSKLYLGKMIHMVLNGDEELNADYAGLNLTTKNFYRNFEKFQKFTDSMKDGCGVARKASSSSSPTSPSSVASLSDLYEFFMGPMYNELLPQPLYFGSIGEAFAEKMIDGGGSLTPGSWRSSDSDEKFEEFERCLREQNANFGLTTAIGNNLVRRILAERQTYETLRNWIAGNTDAVNRIRGVLESLGEGNLNLEKLYFYISVYTHCPEGNGFVNTYLKNSRDFAETFGCPSGSQLKPLKVCSVL